MLRPDGNRNCMGIMVNRKTIEFPFENEKHFRRLCLKGKELGISVFVFSPERIDWQLNQVTGYLYDEDKIRWEENNFYVPHLIYDRYFVTKKQHMALYRQSVAKLKQIKGVRFLNQSLGNKWDIYCRLSKVPSIVPYLPETSLLKNDHSWIRLLQKNKEIFLKPNRGSQGKGTIYIRQNSENSYSIQARDYHNNMIQHNISDIASLSQWMQKTTAERTYLVQPYLTLSTSKGEAFDIRSLVQKNRRGQWQITGIAVRKGKPESVTSNLHGGGTALEAQPFLIKEFGRQTASNLIAVIRKLSAEIPFELESSYGRLAELGIDFGVDGQGNLFILEVNSKPGRTVFSLLPDKKQRYESVYNPVFYARFLLEGIR